MALRAKFQKKSEGFNGLHYILFLLLTLAVFVLCICLGSVSIPLRETLSIFAKLFSGETVSGTAGAIILDVRLPRVLCAGLMGAALSVCGAAMQGLLRNPLADGSTLGVSSGASLGAVFAIAFGITLPGFATGSVMLMAMLFAMLSLFLILGLAHRLDFSFSTNTIILVGVIFTMFSNSIISLIVTFAGNKAKTILFWTMGSLAGNGYGSVVALLIGFLVFAPVLFAFSRELNAFAIGEDNARNIGINVKRTKLIILICVSALIGICVSIGGTIAFVGLVIPHMTRMLTGPNHKRLLPASVFFGAAFLMAADLVSRTVLSPLELPIGVVTSFVGSIAFVFIFFKSNRS